MIACARPSGSLGKGALADSEGDGDECERDDETRCEVAVHGPVDICVYGERVWRLPSLEQGGAAARERARAVIVERELILEMMY